MYCENCGRQLNDGEVCNCTAPVQTPAPVNYTDADSYVASVTEKKKSNKGKIIVAAVIAFVVFFIGGCFVGTLLGQTSEEAGTILDTLDEIYADKDFIAGDSGVAYTEGKIVGNTYTNEWANIKIAMPDGYENAPEEYYSDYEADDSVCAMYFVAEDGDEISVNISEASYTSPKNYTAYYHSSIETYLKDDYATVFNQAYIDKLEFKKKYDALNIGGREYLLSCTYVEHEEEGVLIVYCTLCAQLDDKLIDITIVADTLDECAAVINQIGSCN